MNESLNIYEWTKVLCLKAINSSYTFAEAAAKLGVHPRTVSRYIKTFGFVQGDYYGGKIQWKEGGGINNFGSN